MDIAEAKKIYEEATVQAEDACKEAIIREKDKCWETVSKALEAYLSNVA